MNITYMIRNMDIDNKPGEKNDTVVPLPSNFCTFSDWIM